MIKSKVDAQARELLLGHSIQLGDSYYRPSPEELLEEYLKCVDLCTINNEHRLQRKVKQMEVQHTAEWELLRKDLVEMKKQLGIVRT